LLRHKFTHFFHEFLRERFLRFLRATNRWSIVFIIEGGEGAFVIIDVFITIAMCESIRQGLRYVARLLVSFFFFLPSGALPTAAAPLAFRPGINVCMIFAAFLL
jgi:hypothetical protein